MKFEIERKFLLKNDGWKAAIVSASKLSDGLLSNLNGNKVRVRISDEKGTVAIKGPKNGRSRVELEYDIPLAEAEYMLSTLCGEDVCDKVRYHVSHGMHVWYVDVYQGALDGFVIAELELTEPNERFSLPAWIGREVTGNPHYGKWATLTRCIAVRNSNNSNIANVTDLKVGREFALR